MGNRIVKHELGRQAERRVTAILRAKEFSSVKWRSTVSVTEEGYWDIAADGRLLEVKGANFSRKYKMWRFNLHRHGKLSPHRLTAYIFCLRGVPFVDTAWTYLVIPYADLSGKKAVSITPRSLMRNYAKYIDAWDFIKTQPKLQ